MSEGKLGITIELPEEEVVFLENKAKKWGIERNDLIRHILRLKMKIHKKKQMKAYQFYSTNRKGKKRAFNRRFWIRLGTELINQLKKEAKLNRTKSLNRHIFAKISLVNFQSSKLWSKIVTNN